MTIGARILEIRQAKAMSQKEFAERLGVSKSAVASYEKGQQTPGSSVLASICEHFKVEPRWLLLGKGDMYVLDLLGQKEGRVNRNNDINRHNEAMETLDSEVVRLEEELGRIKKELLVVQMERDRAKDEAYKAMKVALKAHGTDLDKE